MVKTHTEVVDTQPKANCAHWQPGAVCTHKDGPAKWREKSWWGVGWSPVEFESLLPTPSAAGMGDTRGPSIYTGKEGSFGKIIYLANSEFDWLLDLFFFSWRSGWGSDGSGQPRFIK